MNVATVAPSCTPAVALTALARPKDRVSALAAGFQTHLPKPVDPSELVLAVANPAGLEAYRPGERPLPPVDVASEVGRARRALAGIDADGVVELSENQPLRPTLGNLLAELRKGCDLLYLVAHGAITDESRLWLENDTGGADVVAGSQLLGCFRELAVLPRLVVPNVVTLALFKDPAGNRMGLVETGKA